MRIGVTDTMDDRGGIERYLSWLRSGSPDVKCATLSYEHGVAHPAGACDGIVLSGGGDVDPVLYGAQTGHPTVHDVDQKRDSFERGVLDRALSEGIPILGICRGLQLANVHLGGSLIVDLEEAGFSGHQDEQGNECDHGVLLERPGVLKDSVGTSAGTVNSRHHQAADTPGEGLRVVARSGDGVVEAMEFDQPGMHPFFLLVQWHPERMNGGDNPFSADILRRFITAVQTKNETKR